ncbi:MAG: sigma-70 family RNA polymerase sigma factor [Myxococcota bacterium]
MTSDAELLYAWRDGNARAGEELFARYYPLIDRFFSNKVSEDPGDLIQKTLEACVQGRDRIDEGRSFRSYLFAIAYNVLRRYLRERYQCREQELSSRSIHDIAPGPSTLMAESEQTRLLALALRRLPLKLQVVLELRYWEDMSSPEIESMLGTNASTVRTLLRRGRKQLSEVLGEVNARPEILEDTVSNLDAWVEKLRAELRKKESG